MEDVDQLVTALYDGQIQSLDFASSMSTQDVITLVSRLKMEADRHWFIDANQSLRFAAMIVEIGHARNDLGSVALGTMARGDALGILGHVSEAWATLDEAGELFVSIGAEIGWARTRIGRLHLSVELKRVPQALKDAERAAQIFRDHYDLDKLLRLKLNTGAVHNFLGEYRAAIDLFEESLNICDELGQASDTYRGAIHLNLGYSYNFTGSFHKAQSNYEAAYRVLEQQGAISGMTIAILNMGYLSLSQRRYRTALQLLHQAADHAGEKMPRERALARRAIVEVHLHLNRYEDACSLAEEVVSTFRLINNDYGLARTLLYLAIGQMELGEYDSANTALDEAQSIYGRLKAIPWLGRVALQQGRMLLRNGDGYAALCAAREAAVSFLSCGERSLYGEALLLQAESYHAGQQIDEAADTAFEVLRTAHMLRDPLLRYEAHLLLGRIAQESDQIGQAIRRYAVAVNILDRMQRELTITMRPSFLANKQDALRSLIRLHLGRGDMQEAFQALERSKAQVWLQHILNHEHLIWRVDDDPCTQVLVAELESLRTIHFSYERFLRTPDEEEKSHSLTPEHIQAEIDRCERRMRELTEQLYLQSGGDNLSPFQVPTLANIQARLEESDTLLAYFSDGDNWWVFVVRHNFITAQQLPIENLTLQLLIDQVEKNMARALRVAPVGPIARNLTRLIQQTLSTLYTTLVAPIIEWLQNSERLIVVPSGEIHYLPLHLVYNGEFHLIEKYEVTLLPMAGLINRESPVHPPGALVVAHSSGGRLPQTLAEAQVVSRAVPTTMYVENMARRSVLRHPPRQILHIASHGKQRIDRHDLSFLELADGELYADDLLQIDLSYELVIFSGCETGRMHVAPGDELVGLGRGILYAGAGAFIASLWHVEDELTVRFMEMLYANLARGETKSASMRNAQLAIKSTMGGLHPAYWGAFTLVGNPAPLSAVR